MGSIIKIVPVDEFDGEAHERSIREYGKPRLIDGDLVPSEEDHAADLRQITEVQRALAALTPTQRRSSRWPTKDELKRAFEAVSAETGDELWFGPYQGPWSPAPSW